MDSPGVRARSSSRFTSCAALLVLALAGAPASGQTLRAVHRFAGTERPTPRAAVLVDGGALAALVLDGEDEHLALVSTRAVGTVVEPAWRLDLNGAHGTPHVAASADGIQVAVLAQFLAPGSNVSRTTVVHGRRAHGGARHAWSTAFPGVGSGRALVAVSRDGATFAAARQRVAGVVELALFDPDTGTPHALPLVFADGLRRLAFSADGSALLVGAGLEDHVIDVRTGVGERVAFRSASTEAVALSGDGTCLAHAEVGAVRVYERRAGAWTIGFSDSLGPTWLGVQLALSDDGRRLAVAFWNTLDGASTRVRAYDLEAPRLLWERGFSASGPYQNLPVALRFDGAAGRLAFAQWGDDGGPLPEVVVFDVATGAIAVQEDLPGSAMAIDLSHDGRVLVVAAKPVHANRFGDGGEVRVHDLDEPRDDVEGTPQLGDAIAFRAPGDPGDAVAFLTGRAVTAGLVLPGIVGELFLEPSSAWVLGVTSADGLGIARLPVAIPARPELVGARPFVQALVVPTASAPHWRAILAPLILR